MPKIKLKNGVSIYYEEFGKNKGNTIVFIAGFTADHHAWEVVAKKCARKNHHTIIFDNRGVGQSDCPDYPYTAEMLADDTKGLCEKLGIKKACFVGSSLGGQIVMTLAYQYPNLVENAVISNSIMKNGSFLKGYEVLLDAHLELLRRGNQQTENRDEIKKYKEIYIKTNLGWIFSGKFLSKGKVIEQQVNGFIENQYPITEKGFLHQENVFKNFDASLWLKTITCPCLVIAAEGDKVLPFKKIKKVAYAIPKAQLLLFTGKVGHLPHVEKPDEFTKVICNFVGKIKANVKGTLYVPRPSANNFPAFTFFGGRKLRGGFSGDVKKGRRFSF